jgi:4-hydroxy-3-methylbut-2-en-1-yl diphosphate reductase
MTQSLLVLVPLRAEAAALRASSDWRVIRTGMGPARARNAAARGLAVEAPAVAIAGVCAAVSSELRPGDVVCATELRREDAEPVTVPAGALLAAAVRRLGVRALAGPVVSVERLEPAAARRRFEPDGALAVDMESAWLAAAAGGRPLAVLRVVVEPAGRGLADLRTVTAGTRALLSLRRASAALADWAAQVAPAVTPDALAREPALR